MNKEIITKGLALLKYTYPHTFKDYTKEDTEMMIIVWLDAFKEDNPKCFETAIKRLMKKSKWCPSVAEVKQEIALLTNPSLQLSVDEEWNNVISQIRKHGTYITTEEFNKFNPLTLKVVRNIGWRRLCLSENIEFERKTFYSMFESYQKSNENVALLSQSEMTLAELTKMVELKKQQVNLIEEKKEDLF